MLCWNYVYYKQVLPEFLSGLWPFLSLDKPRRRSPSSSSSGDSEPPTRSRYFRRILPDFVVEQIINVNQMKRLKLNEFCRTLASLFIEVI